MLPIMGHLSDKYGRTRMMTVSACGLAVLGPLMFPVIGTGSVFLAFLAQTLLMVFVSMWVAPMAAWLAVSFPENIRLTAVSIGYNISLATVGGFSPAIATLMVDHVGVRSPGYIYTVVAVMGLIGIYTAPPRDNDLTTEATLESQSTASWSELDVEDQGQDVDGESECTLRSIRYHQYCDQ